MSEIALYRKYRPDNFENLVGQDHVKTTLINALKSEHVAHAYLFAGPRGTGKTSTARLVAKALNCQNLKEGFEPCGECEFCREIINGQFIDLIEIDAASNRGIDEVRDLNEKIRFAPSRGKYKIYIIDEVHMMTKEAFNALLKTLEEPPSHAHFVLATTEIHKIPETIISRCQRFDFKRISEKTIVERLRHIAKIENVTAEDKALEAISRYVEGGMRDAVGLFEQLTANGELKFERIKEILGISDHGILEDLFEALTANKSREAIKIVHSLHDQGSDLKQFLHEFIDSMRIKMLKSVENGDSKSIARLVELINFFQEAEREMNSASIPQLPMEIAIIRSAGNIQKVEESEPEIKKIVQEVEDPRPHQSISKLDLENLKLKWPRITERIKLPALRNSLKNAMPLKVEGSEITLQFGTNFYKEKTMEHDNRVELEKMIMEFFGAAVKLNTVVKALEIKPVMEEEKSAPKASGVEEALEIFGGEIMD